MQNIKLQGQHFLRMHRNPNPSDSDPSGLNPKSQLKVSSLYVKKEEGSAYSFTTLTREVLDLVPYHKDSKVGEMVTAACDHTIPCKTS